MCVVIHDFVVLTNVRIVDKEEERKRWWWWWGWCVNYICIKEKRE